MQDAPARTCTKARYSSSEQDEDDRENIEDKESLDNSLLCLYPDVLIKMTPAQSDPQQRRELAEKPLGAHTGAARYGPGRARHSVLADKPLGHTGATPTLRIIVLLRMKQARVGMMEVTAARTTSTPSHSWWYLSRRRRMLARKSGL